jgi:hypothetical protein
MVLSFSTSRLLSFGHTMCGRAKNSMDILGRHFKQCSLTVTRRHSSASLRPASATLAFTVKVTLLSTTPLSSVLSQSKRLVHGCCKHSVNLSHHSRGRLLNSLVLCCERWSPTLVLDGVTSKRFYPGTVQKHASALAVKRPIRKKQRSAEVVCLCVCPWCVSIIQWDCIITNVYNKISVVMKMIVSN